MWVGNPRAATRLRKLPFSTSTGNNDCPRLTKKGSPRTATRRRPLCSERRKLPASARQRRVALSRMASKMGCKSCGELAMARSTSEMAVCCSMRSVTRSCGLEAVLSAWIAGHNHELFDEIRNYHRHEDFRIVSFWLRFRDAQGMKHN